ncbi:MULTISPECIES: RNA polymerase sigma factor [unclassified Dysgonomonas]|uniref:RNA polymerase sigma factor n=1 Tax=unclassified Dysgonomonas TaxID=2630389 RepID=UPI0013EDFCE8|nr:MULTISPECIES: RNA polymerase sigma factor [unclassified Dysgonomonas]
MNTTNHKNNKEFEDKLVDLQNNMMNFALTLTSNREEAKDLLQETTLRALDNKEKYYENVNFKGWVFTIMHNIFVNNYRRVVRSQTMIDQTENLYHLNMPQDSGFDTPDGAYTVAEITKVINSFSDEYKVPFTMHVSGYKYEEIAQNLVLPIGTVKSRIFFARKRLQELLKDYRYQDKD